MEENTNVAEVVEEIRSADEETLRSTIEKWFESTRTAGMKIGAQFISAAIFGVIQKHTKKKTGAKASLRDYQRCVDEIMKIIAIQLETQQNDSKESEINNKVDEVNDE